MALSKIVHIKNIAITLLAVLAFGCQPDYGHLQPEYEQLLEVQEQVQTATQQVRSNQKKGCTDQSRAAGN